MAGLIHHFRIVKTVLTIESGGLSNANHESSLFFRSIYYVHKRFCLLATHTDRVLEACDVLLSGGAISDIQIRGLDFCNLPQHVNFDSSNIHALKWTGQQTCLALAADICDWYLLGMRNEISEIEQCNQASSAWYPISSRIRKRWKGNGRVYIECTNLVPESKSTVW